MEDNIFEKEKEINENTEPENAEVEAVEAEGTAEQNAEEMSWSAIKRPKQEAAEEKIPEVIDIVPESDEVCEQLPEPEVQVAEVEKIEPIEEYSTDTKTLVKMAKKVGRAARREAKENEVDYEDDGGIFKSKSFRKTWEKICLALLILAIGIPVGLLVYIIWHFFL